MTNLIHLPSQIRSLSDLHEGFSLSHSLSEHQLLSPAGIQALADRLPAGSAELGLAGLVAEGGLSYEPDDMTDAGPAVRSLAGDDASVYLHNVERDPQFCSLVDDIMAEVSRRLSLGAADIRRREGYLFLTGGTATTFAHVDHEYNFLLVVRGRKRVFIAEVPSEEGELALESMHSGGYGSCASVPTAGSFYEIGPGEGVFIPPRGAHYVENGPGPCAALSVVFGTDELDDQAKIYRANALLRRLGLDPRPPGGSPKVDHAKLVFADVARGARGALRAITNLGTGS